MWLCLHEISQRNGNEDSASTLNDLLNEKGKKIMFYENNSKELSAVLNI